MGALQHLDSIIYDFAVWNLIQINAISFILWIELGISLLLYNFIFPFSEPDRSIVWSVSSSGQLRVVWAERKSFFGENNPVRLDWRTERAGEAGSVRGSAASVTLTSLRLGGRYLVTLTDLQTNVSDSFNFTACKLELASALNFNQTSQAITGKIGVNICQCYLLCGILFPNIILAQSGHSTTLYSSRSCNIYIIYLFAVSPPHFPFFWDECKE